jgi:hypothetical protein
MIKRLSNVILLIGLSTLIFAYVFTASGSRSEIYGPHTADEQYALVVHKRMNLTQANTLAFLVSSLLWALRIARCASR